MTRNNKRKIIKNIVCALLFLCLTWGLFPVTTKAAEDSGSVVRVGYYESSNFSEGAEEGKHKSGYAYEYLQKISAATGWHYEYVYGSWAEILDKLMNGEIDVMAGVSYSDERSKSIFFPNYPMGFENYYIYAYEYQPFVNGDISLIKGCNVGCNKNSFMEYFLEEWNEKNGDICRIVLFDGNNELYEALNNGKIDAVVDTDNSVVQESKLIPVVNLGQADYYLAVSRQSPEILSELNDSLAEISMLEPYYVNDLHNKYFAKSAVRVALSDSEKEWIEANRTIRIGYEKNHLAFCGYDEEIGELAGALKTFVDSMNSNFGQCGFEIETVPFDTVEESLQAMANGEVDVVFPIYHNLCEAEERDVLVSNGLASTGMIAIINDPKHFDEFGDNRVAVAKGFTDIIWYISENYPNWEIVEYDTFDKCVSAVKKGAVDCLVESSYVYKTLVDYRQISMVSLSKRADASFAVKREDNELISLLNRAMAVGSDADIIATLTQYANSNDKTTFTEFAKDNLPMISIFLGGIIVVLALLWARALYLTQKERKLNAELAKARENAEAANRARQPFFLICRMTSELP